jgi:hypothetical protein
MPRSWTAFGSKADGTPNFIKGFGLFGSKPEAVARLDRELMP